MTRKVMVCDDEEGVLMLVSATLGNDDRYRLLLARDGEEALNLALQEKPDLLFLDIKMPKMNGIQVCQALKGDPRTAHIKVIMLTSVAQEETRRRALEAGADGYFTKPFSPTRLLEKVADMLALP